MQRDTAVVKVFEFRTAGNTSTRELSGTGELELYPRSFMMSLADAWRASRNTEGLRSLVAHREVGRATGARF